MDPDLTGTVEAVHRSEVHQLRKDPQPWLHLVAGLGVAGDTHFGATVEHQSRLTTDPSQPNLRQVHLLQAELLDELQAASYEVGPGDMGENVTTRGLDLPALPTGTVLRVGGTALVAVTGLCSLGRQLDQLHPGLRGAVSDRRPDGELAPRAGVMAVVVSGGPVEVGDVVEARFPPGPPLPLGMV